jgi:hypothetical protein
MKEQSMEGQAEYRGELARISIALLVASLALTLYADLAACSNSFTAAIESRPYRGAVVAFRYAGSTADLGSVRATVNLCQAGVCIQRDAPVVAEGGVLVAELIDLMFKLGTIQAQLTIRSGTQTPSTAAFMLEFQHFYPWIDWMLQPGDGIGFGDDRFDYTSTFRPNHPPSTTWYPHASWDFSARAAGVGVFCGTEGVVARAFEMQAEADVWIYSPSVGGYLQYGHVVPISGLREGQVVHPGQQIGSVMDRPYDHIHFSVFRPLKWDDVGQPVWHPRTGEFILGLPYYSDPFYFHEPTTWGYWNESTLPSGWVDHMRQEFEKYNSGVVPQ